MDGAPLFLGNDAVPNALHEEKEEPPVQRNPERRSSNRKANAETGEERANTGSGTMYPKRMYTSNDTPLQVKKKSTDNSSPPSSTRNTGSEAVKKAQRRPSNTSFNTDSTPPEQPLVRHGSILDDLRDAKNKKGRSNSVSSAHSDSSAESNASECSSSRKRHHHHHQRRRRSSTLREKTSSSQALKREASSSSSMVSTTPRHSVTQSSQAHPPTHELKAITDTEIQKMKDLFAKYDKENTGSVSADKLPVLLAALGHPMPQDQAIDLLRQVDVNDNGTLEFDEFLNIVKIFKDVAQFRLYGGSDTTQVHIYGTAQRFKKILPDCYWRWGWDLFMLVVGVYVWVSVLTLHLGRDEDSFHSYGDALMIPDIVVTLPILLEIIFLFNMSVYDGQHMTEDSEYIIKHYLSTWFVVDALALLPMRLFTRSFYPSLILAHFRLLFTLRIGHLFQHSWGQIGITRSYIVFHYSVVPAVTYFYYFICLVHCFAVIWYRLFFGRETYSSCVYVTIYTLSGAGYGDRIIDSDAQWWFGSLSCILAMLINGLVIGSVVTFLQTADVEHTRRSRLVETLAVLNFFEVPVPLQEEILQFQNHVMKKDVQTAYGYLVDHLPPEIKMNLTMQFKIRLINPVKLLHSAHDTVKIALCQALEQVVFPPEEYITLAQEEGEEMYFINYGFIDILTATGIYLTTLGSEDHFAENVLLQKKGTKYIHGDSSKSLTYVELLLLSRDSFYIIREHFPKFDHDIEQLSIKYMSERSQLLGSHTSPDDTFAETRLALEKAAAECILTVEEHGSDSDEGSPISKKHSEHIVEKEKPSPLVASLGLPPKSPLAHSPHGRSPRSPRRSKPQSVDPGMTEASPRQISMATIGGIRKIHSATDDVPMSPAACTPEEMYAKAINGQPDDLINFIGEEMDELQRMISQFEFAQFSFASSLSPKGASGFTNTSPAIGIGSQLELGSRSALSCSTELPPLPDVCEQR